MIDLEFLRGLIEAVDQSGIDRLEIRRQGTRIRIAKTPAAAVNAAPLNVPLSAPHPTVHSAPPAAAPETPTASTPPAAPEAEHPEWIEIKSPMVGTFYRSPSPEAPAYVEVGNRVAKGQTLCILEAMKLMNELESDWSGTVREICVENAEPVEYGQLLFRIEPED